ncbi:ShlB/FhaC/HecB family hemolysin secretion/activation protein [Scytonema sp. PRP1]|uniref:ShlB/FhaC/HecB family hemolysin secretion/activation protein n=1 Tax=Scytonema sp. PRP1 TaxID=3120513 RepID=UPI00300C5EC6
MNLKPLPRLPSKEYKLHWGGLVLFSSLSAVGQSIAPLPTWAQTVDQAVEISNFPSAQPPSQTATIEPLQFSSTVATPETFPEMELSKEKQLIAQTPPTNQPPPSQSIPRSPTPQQSPPETPQQLPSENPLQTPSQPEPSQTPQNEDKKPSCDDTSRYKPAPRQGTDPDSITVTKFNFEGNTAFSDEKLESLLQDFIKVPLSFPELLRTRTVITDYYVCKGYITTGAYIPIPRDQTVGSTVTIKIVEGSVEEIRVNGTRRLNSGYVRSRLRLGTSTPLNQNKLLNAIRLLQIDPLIESISAELRAGVKPGTNVLEVQVTEADSFSSQINLNNGRSPSVGSFNRGIGLTQANLLGLGDGLSVSYNNTQGSNNVNLSYTLPLNARNGTLSFSYGTSSSAVIERPFNELDINSDSRYYQLNLRQPIIQTPSQEFALGLIASRTESETSAKVFGPLPEGFAISPGADSEGRTRISAIRFYQEWVKQSRSQVLAARSQFSFGIDAFNATINRNPPDSRFFVWRGQFQWVRLFGLYLDNLPTAPTLLFRTDVQLADRPLALVEQFGLGGIDSIRGYRQDALLTDNGVLASIEFRLPVARIREWQTVVQLIPFAEVGYGWDRGDLQLPGPNTIASVGLGLQVVQSRYFRARLDWGIPLVNLDSEKRTWQENGIYFSLELNPF